MGAFEAALAPKNAVSIGTIEDHRNQPEHVGNEGGAKSQRRRRSIETVRL
jgi:hypothetical protein